MTTAKQLASDAVEAFSALVRAGDPSRLQTLAGDLTTQVTSQLEEVRTQVLDAQRATAGAAEETRIRLLEQLTARLDELAEESREAQTGVEARIAELQAEALALPAQARARLEGLQADLGPAVERLEARALEVRDQLVAALPAEWAGLERLLVRDKDKGTGGSTDGRDT